MPYLCFNTVPECNIYCAMNELFPIQSDSYSYKPTNRVHAILSGLVHVAVTEVNCLGDNNGLMCTTDQRIDNMKSLSSQYGDVCDRVLPLDISSYIQGLQSFFMALVYG